MVCLAPHSFALRGIFTLISGVFSNGANRMERVRCFQDSNTEGWWLRLLAWLCACLWECCSRDVYARLRWSQWFQGAQARKAGPPLNWDACAARWLGGLGAVHLCAWSSFCVCGAEWFGLDGLCTGWTVPCGYVLSWVPRNTLGVCSRQHCL